MFSQFLFSDFFICLFPIFFFLFRLPFFLLLHYIPFFSFSPSPSFISNFIHTFFYNSTRAPYFRSHPYSLILLDVILSSSANLSSFSFLSLYPYCYLPPPFLLLLFFSSSFNLTCHGDRTYCQLTKIYLQRKGRNVSVFDSEQKGWGWRRREEGGKE